MSRYKVKRTVKFDKTEVECDICGKICKGMRSLKSHKTQMHKGDKDTSHRGAPKGHKSWNKGLTVDTDDRVRNITEKVKVTMREKVTNGTYVKSVMSQEAKGRLSERMSLHNPGGRCKWYDVDGVKVQGRWERDVAIILSEMGIKWLKPTTKKHVLKYQRDGEIKSYTPDFYIEDGDFYVEVKGYWWGDDKRKMELVKEYNPTIDILLVEENEYREIISGNVEIIVNKIKGR